MNAVEVYRVGILADVHHHGWRVGLRRSRRYIRHCVATRDWRALRNTFNGWLAEHGSCPHNAGRGWTARAAQRRVERLCAAVGAERETEPTR